MSEAEALRLVIRQRIRDLWAYRAWYRSHRWATWTDLRAENAVELRALVVLSRAARVLAAATPPDPRDWREVDPRDFFLGWTEPERREAFGK